MDKDNGHVVNTAAYSDGPNNNTNLPSLGLFYLPENATSSLYEIKDEVNSIIARNAARWTLQSLIRNSIIAVESVKGKLSNSDRTEIKKLLHSIIDEI